MEKKVYSVSDITRTIKTLLEESLPTIWIEGEISNLKAHYSGHLYFSLKDNDAQISAVIWRTRAEQISFNLEDGMQIKALGNIRLYEKSGRYQIDILQAQPAGVGNLQQAFEQLKTKLLSEGLFAEENKKAIPEFPQKVSIVTSPTGAAIRDILDVLKRRAPYLEILIRAAKVQGINASTDIASAIEEINKHNKADVIIVGRGGGSLEDLWAFNEEQVARAIFQSKIPVISAVGHEVDFTISDFVADLRAATPSAAAELVVTDRNELAGLFLGIKQQMQNAVQANINFLNQKVSSLEKSHGLKRFEDLLNQYAQRIDDLSSRSQNAFLNQFFQKKEKTQFLTKRLNSLNHEATLARGFSITYADGKIVKDISKLKKWQVLETKVANGEIESTINKLKY
ncbi:MAG: exodeoxyribonuclease VII large subunit [Calditrichaeota bacterium]|nr:MAG: exodeoxyribonuclease VII large subunit [Calditrichota bacterium]MBL1204222.1 exodeoxyribonuclease VII large subunit [Calditrichota bacterium]NOG44052.1 exodeoxyribonuclease VII large subunit [Calditrichota bacterium]